MCMHVTCPEGYYDVNVEPSKDVVCFGSDVLVMNVFGVLLKGLYPENDPIDKDLKDNGSAGGSRAGLTENLNGSQAESHRNDSVSQERILSPVEEAHALEASDPQEAGLPSPAISSWSGARANRGTFHSMNPPSSPDSVRRSQEIPQPTKELLPLQT